MLGLSLSFIAPYIPQEYGGSPLKTTKPAAKSYLNVVIGNGVKDVNRKTGIEGTNGID